MPRDVDIKKKATLPDGRPVPTLKLTDWLKRDDISEPDFMLYPWLSTTTRMLMAGYTGLGKTNFSLALAFAIASGGKKSGGEFLGMKIPRPRTVLYIDGEMSRLQMREWLGDAADRQGYPDTLHILSREDVEDMEPLNTKAGQEYIDAIIEHIGQVDLVIFDNLMSLLEGSMKDEEIWANVIAWIRDLTRRNIGQIWVDHTGRAQDRSYGTITKEWQMDGTVILQKKEVANSDIAFELTFKKKRGARAETRYFFEPCVVTLADDKWNIDYVKVSNGGDSSEPKLAPLKDRDLKALAILKKLCAKKGEPHAMAPDGVAVRSGQWRKECLGKLPGKNNERAQRAAFERAMEALINHRKIHRDDSTKAKVWVWLIIEG